MFGSTGSTFSSVSDFSTDDTPFPASRSTGCSLDPFSTCISFSRSEPSGEDASFPLSALDEGLGVTDDFAMGWTKPSTVCACCRGSAVVGRGDEAAMSGAGSSVWGCVACTVSGGVECATCGASGCSGGVTAAGVDVWSSVGISASCPSRVANSSLFCSASLPCSWEKALAKDSLSGAHYQSESPNRCTHSMDEYV